MASSAWPWGINSGGTDSLYISLQSSSSNLSWLAAPRWTAVPYDDPQDPGSGFRVADIIFTEMYDGIAYIVVNITTNRSDLKIVRYHIDTTRSTGRTWVRHHVPVNLEAGKYTSFIGGEYNGLVDGDYTMGTVTGAPQLIQQPVINVYSEYVKLKLPPKT